MTGMPAASALWATGVSAAPSCGSTTSASGLLEITCSICCACESASAASSSRKSTSSYLSAAAFAFFEIAPSQPWSVGGTLATIRTVPPPPDPPLPLPLSSPVVSTACADPPPFPPLPPSSSSPQAAAPSASSTATASTISRRKSDIAPPPLLDVSQPRLRSLEQDRPEDDRSLDHLLDLGREVHLRHQAEDEREREHPQEGADDRRAAAREARAADHDGADRVELVEVPADRRGASEPCAQQHRGDAGEQAREHVDAQDRPSHGHARDPRRLAVAAHRHDEAAVARAVEDDPTGDHDPEEDVHGDRDPGDPPGAEPQQRERRGVAERAAVEIEQADRQLVVEQQRDPSRDREHRKRRDERDDAAVGDRDRVDRAEQRPEEDRAGD